MSRFPQNLCVNSQCALDDVRVSLQSALVICASAGVLRPTEMSCVRIWFHFPPALTPSARCAFSSRLCAYKRARMDASTLPSQLQCYGGGHRDSDSES